MLSDYQIQDLIDTNFQAHYFTWRMDAKNPDNLQEFFNCIESELDEKTLALMLHLGDCYDDCEQHITSENYLVLEDEEADELAKQRANERLSDELDNVIPKHLMEYFDTEKYIDDQLNDRGYLLAYYDGCEEEETVNNTTYYIYKQ